MDLHTPLYDEHIALGGRMVSFAGYELPVQYEGVIAEHMAVRTRVGIFDVSHMGEIAVTGSGASDYLDKCMGTSLGSVPCGKVKYAVFCYENATVADDVLIYKQSEDRFLVVVNAANKDKDAKLMKAAAGKDVTVEDISSQVAQIAVQGREAKNLLSSVPEKYYTFLENSTQFGVNCLISRTGYTGEDGFELYMENRDAPKVWRALVAGGATPCGLGARDTLRLEAGMPLYGHELSDKLTLAQSNSRIGLVAEERGIMRENLSVYADEELVGKTTSGTYSPFFKNSIAMAIVGEKYRAIGTRLTVDIRGKRINARVVPLPFYKKSY